MTTTQFLDLLNKQEEAEEQRSLYVSHSGGGHVASARAGNSKFRQSMPKMSAAKSLPRLSGGGGGARRSTSFASTHGANVGGGNGGLQSQHANYVQSHRRVSAATFGSGGKRLNGGGNAILEEDVLFGRGQVGSKLESLMGASFLDQEAMIPFDQLKQVRPEL